MKLNKEDINSLSSVEFNLDRLYTGLHLLSLNEKLHPDLRVELGIMVGKLNSDCVTINKIVNKLYKKSFWKKII